MKQKINFLFVLLIGNIFISAPSLCAAGKTEELEQAKLNNDWTLCITAFDVSALPPSRQIMGSLITKKLADSFKTLSYRLRISPEYAYYEDYAWSQSRAAAAKALAAKNEERSLLLYQGKPEWQYRQELRKIDTDIVKLREELDKKNAEKPSINQEPKFGLVQGNKDGNFPAPPKDGEEYRFCKSQNADAFLAASIREYYGRCYLTLRLYTLYTRSFIYEDSVIFSSEDINSAVDEIDGRCIAVLAGNKPAALAIHADPPETLVLTNQNFAGRGQTETREYPPGKITVAVSAEGYKPEQIETELKAGELTSIDVSLSRLTFGDVNIVVPDSAAVSVYQGAMYIGEAPLTLRMPLDQLDYISVEAKGGKIARAVYYTPVSEDEPYTLSLKTKLPPPTGQRRVNKARSAYYWAWGGTWITGIAAWISYGIFTGQNSVLAQSSSSAFYEDTQRMYYISMGAIIAVGAAVGYEIFQMTRYLYTSTEDTTPIVKREKTKK